MQTLLNTALICYMPAPTESLLPPYLTADQTSWPLPGQQHVGAYLACGDTWEVLHLGPGWRRDKGVYDSRTAAVAAAYDLAERELRVAA